VGIVVWEPGVLGLLSLSGRETLGGMTDKEVQAAETEVLDLIKRLRNAPQNTAIHETLARIACKAVDALPQKLSPGLNKAVDALPQKLSPGLNKAVDALRQKLSPGLKNEARKRYEWPVMVSLNRSIATPRTKISPLLDGLGLGEELLVVSAGAAWEWNDVNRLVYAVICEFEEIRCLRKRRSGMKYWDGEEMQVLANELAIEACIQGLPSFLGCGEDGTENWGSWLKLIWEEILAMDGPTLNKLIKSKDRRPSKDDASEDFVSGYLQPQVKTSVMSFAGANKIR
jgi:hypothetical protein